jgi:hypothetical protein
MTANEPKFNNTQAKNIDIRKGMSGSESLATRRSV